MSRGVDFAKSVFYVATRGAERVLPPVALWFLLWPLTQVLGARQAWRRTDRVPAARLPLAPGSARPPLFKRWRYFSQAQTHWWLLGWLDRLADAKWQRRLTVNGLDKLTKVLTERPVIICTVHTTSVVALAAWLRSRGIPTAHVPMDPTWFTGAARKRKVALAEKMGMAFTIRPGAPQDMIEFLKPGHTLVLTADFTGGRMTQVPWSGGSVVVATGLFRLARLTGAAVVPVIIFNTGRWRYEVSVFEPLPQDMVQSGDSDAGARYMVECLMPLAAERPEQAMEVLLATVS